MPTVCVLALTDFSSMPATRTSRRMFMWSVTTAKRSFGSRRPGWNETADYKGKELNKIEQIIEEHQEGLMENWDEYFAE